MRFVGLREGPEVREEKVGDAATADGERVRNQDGRVERVDEEAHEGEVSEERDEAAGEMEAEESGKRRWCLRPREVEMPEEVVEECELDREGGGEEVVVRERAIEEGKRGELDGDAEETDEVEAEEAGEWVHRFGSC
jgi:hypothetical protein